MSEVDASSRKRVMRFVWASMTLLALAVLTGCWMAWLVVGERGVTIYHPFLFLALLTGSAFCVLKSCQIVRKLK